MSLSDPQTISATTLVRTGAAIGEGTFSSTDGTLKLTVRHKTGRRHRRLVRLDQSKVVADPMVPANNIPVGMSCYLVMDVPLNGYSVAEAKAVVNGFVAWLAASTGAVVEDLLSGEQ